MQIKDKVELILKEFIAAIGIARVYSTEHPRSQEAFIKLYAAFEELLAGKEKIVIGIVSNELVFENTIFFELSRRSLQFINLLKNKKIQRLAFHQGLTLKELSDFAQFLTIAKPDTAVGEVQDFLTASDIKNISVSNLSVESEVVSNSSNSVEYLKKYESSLDQTAASLESVLNNRNLDAMGLKLSMNDIMDNLLGRYHEFSRLSILKRRDLYTFTHLLNVAILSMHFASRLNYVREDVLDIGLAALFHDIGKIYISDLVKKTGALTGEEFDRIKNHSMLGAEMLIKYVDHLGIVPVVVAYEHHLGYNLSGYPKNRFTRSPHPASMIVTICDVYDALLSRRSYKRDYPPDVVHRIMLNDRGKLFEPDLFDEYFKIMGVWPVGTIVELSNGAIAVVRKEDYDNPYRPIVEVINSSVKETIELVKESGLTISRFLNPLTEGAQYLNKSA